MKWPLIVRRVVGHSMEPTLKEGRVVFATPLLPVGEGDVVVVRREAKEIIKRVTKINSTGYLIEGDNPSHSRDSRAFGEVSREEVIGKVLGVKHG